MHAEACEHVDQAVGTEEIDATPQQVAHARLCHAENLGGLNLSQSARGQRLLQLNEQIGTDQQVLGCVWLSLIPVCHAGDPLNDLTRAFEAVEEWHPNVENRDVGFENLCLVDAAQLRRRGEISPNREDGRQG